MNENMLAAARRLGVRVRLILATGSEIALDGDDVLSFSIEEGADSALLPGCVLSAGMKLTLRNDSGQWRWGGSLRGERPLVGATAKISLLCAEQELPCGVFIVDGVSARERSGKMELSGSDSIPSELSGLFADSLRYPATLEAVWNHLVGQTRYSWSGTVPNGQAVIDSAPKWGKSITLRKAAGWIAQAAGCFVRVNRLGTLELVPCQSGEAHALTADAYMTLDDGFQTYGPVEAVEVTPMDADESFTLRDGDGTGMTVRVEDNPLFIRRAAHLQALAGGLLAQLKGLTLTKASFTWRGDPGVGVGARVSLLDTYGQTALCTVTRQTLRYENGFSAQCECSVPDEGGGGVLRAITPEGGVNANALVGTVNGGLLAVGTVTANAIAAGSITSEKLAAGSVSADKLVAGSVRAEHLVSGSVTAEKIAAGAIDAQAISAVTAAFNELTAGDVSANALYAAFAHVIELAAGSISTGNLTTDQLAAALADVVSLYAKTGEFDLATVENLLANALVLRQGAADSMMITNLAVTSANLLSAVVGNLVLKGTDGKYYSVFIGPDGEIRAEETSASPAAGQPVVETTANLEALTASNLLASSAIIGEILTDALSAGKITAAEALIASATIPALYTTSIQAIGDSIDLSANHLIQLLLGGMDTVNRWFTFDNHLGLVIRKPAWTDSDGVEHPASPWSTVADETGYHIKRADMPGYVGSFARDRLVVEGVQVGGIVARKTAAGGWAWTDSE